MRKLYIPLVLVINFVTNCQAQLFNSFELNTGLSFVKPHHEKDIGLFTNKPLEDNFTSKAGLTAEAVIYSKINNRLALGTGVKFLQSNYKHLVDGGDDGIRTESDILNALAGFPNGVPSGFKKNVAINIIGVPVLCKFELGKKKQWLQAIGGFGFYRTIEKTAGNEVSGFVSLDPIFNRDQIDNISKDYNLTAQLGLRALIKIKNNHAISIGWRTEYFLVQDKYYENGQGNMLGVSATIGYVLDIKQ